MPDETDDLGLEAEEPDEVGEPANLPPEAQKLIAKLKNEAHTLRTQLRRTEMAKEYGDDVLEFVPTSLPLQEQKELAAKLQARLAGQTQDVQATPEQPTGAFQEPQFIPVPIPQAGQTEDERNLAAVAQGVSTTAATTAQSPLSTQEAAELAMRDPATYQRMKQAGLIKLEKLPGSDR